MIEERLVFLREYRDNTMKGVREEGDIKAESTCRQWSEELRDEEYTRVMFKTCFLQADEGNANWSNQALEAYQQHRRTGCTIEISRCILLEVIRTFQQEMTRPRKIGGLGSGRKFVCVRSRHVERCVQGAMPSDAGKF